MPPNGDHTWETYTYLGLSTVIVRERTAGHHELSYVNGSAGIPTTNDAGDVCGDLDRFGRVVDHQWQGTNTSGNLYDDDVDRFAYGYDRGGNRLYEENLVESAMSELYHVDGSSGGYDALGRPTSFSRGTLNGAKDSITGTAAREQDWTLDALGNWDAIETDGVTQTRGHDAQNRITSISGSSGVRYSDNGEMTRDETGQDLTYDAWGRLVSAGSSDYAYDAFDRRIVQGGNQLIYDGQQVIEERDATTGDVDVQYVWSPAYVNAMVLRDRDTTGDEVLNERVYAIHDANFDVTTLADTNGNVIERFAYDPYGERTVLNANFSDDAVGGDGLSDVDFHHGHQGGRHDLSAGLVHFDHRDLDTSLGRWTRQDPLGYIDGMNAHAAYGGSPVTMTDPTGLFGIAPVFDEEIHDGGVITGIAGVDDEADVTNVDFDEEDEVPNLLGRGAPGEAGEVHRDTRRKLNELQEGIKHIVTATGEILIIIGDETMSPEALAGTFFPPLRAAKGASRVAGIVAKYAPDALRNVPGKIDNIAKSVVDILESGSSNAGAIRGIMNQLPTGRTGNTRMLPDDAAVRKAFRVLTVGGRSTRNSGGFQQKILEDGTKITMRPTSRSGGATIDIIYPDGTKEKIHRIVE